MNFTFDPNKAESFETLPKGEYEVFITGTKAITSSQKGTPGIQMVLVIRDDVPPQVKYKGRKIWHTLWFTEKTEGMVQGFLKNVGTEPGKSFSGLEEIAEYIKGKPLRVKTGIREHEGREYPEVAWTLESKAGGFAPAELLVQKDEEKAQEKKNDDPFAGGGSIDISDDDLPF